MLARSAPIPLQYALAFVHVEFSNTQNVKKKKEEEEDERWLEQVDLKW